MTQAAGVIDEHKAFHHFAFECVPLRCWSRVGWPGLQEIRQTTGTMAHVRNKHQLLISENVGRSQATWLKHYLLSHRSSRTDIELRATTSLEATGKLDGTRITYCMQSIKPAHVRIRALMTGGTEMLHAAVAAIVGISSITGISTGIFIG